MTIGGFNFSALQATRMLAQHHLAIGKSLERLATGKRINRVSDDPSGAMAVSNLTVEQTKLAKQLDRLEIDAHKYGAIDGSESVITDMLQELSGLVVRAANTGGLSKEERQGIQVEADQILAGIDHLAFTTVYDGQLIMQDRTTKRMGHGVTIVDPQTGQELKGQGASSVHDLATGGTLNLFDGDLEGAQKVVKSALDESLQRRATAGNISRDIDSQIRELQKRSEETQAARSGIEDVDTAAEVSHYVRTMILEQVSQFALRSLLQHQSQSVLGLLG